MKRRMGGWAVGFVAVLAALTASRLSAQHGTIGLQGAFGDYREVSSDLHYRGSGGGAAASFTYKKLGIEGSIVGLTYKPVSGSSGTAEHGMSARFHHPGARCLSSARSRSRSSC